MEEVNIFSTRQQNKPIGGYLSMKVNAGTVSPGFIGIPSTMGTFFYPVMNSGTTISAATHTPQMVVNLNQGLVINQAAIFGLTTWQSNLKNLNIYTASDFVGDFALKYQIIEPEKVYNFLFENEFLTPLVSQAVNKIEKYFQGRIKNLHLRLQDDPENQGNYSTLILQVESSTSIKEVFELLTKFQTEWLIPNFGSKISQFSVDII